MSWIGKAVILNVQHQNYSSVLEWSRILEIKYMHSRAVKESLVNETNVDPCFMQIIIKSILFKYRSNHFSKTCLSILLTICKAAKLKVT